MKTTLRLAIVMALLLTLGVLTASAQGPTGNYASGIACVNLENTPGNFVITFYDQAGAEQATISDSIGAKGSKTYFTPSATYASGGLTEGFLGSAVVSSDVQMACSVNTQTNGGTVRVGTSNGVAANSTGTKLYATQILNYPASYRSYVAVQNAGNAQTTVTYKYFDRNGAEVHSGTQTIPANSSFVFYQDNGDLAANFLGSATFESDGQPLAGTVIMYNAGTDGSSAQLLSYNTFTGGSTVVYAPRLVKNLSFVGFTSGWACQNVSNSPVTIQAAITLQDQSDSNNEKSTSLTSGSINPGQSWSGFMGSTLGNATLDGSTAFVGSATITATGGDIACTFNESNDTTYAGLGSTYGGIPSTGATTTMFFPQIVALGGSSFRGGFQIANTTGTATTCDYTFSNGDTVTGVALSANGALSVFAESVLTNNKTTFNGSVEVTCGQPIVGIYNLAAVTIAGDTFATNNGINQ